MKRLLSLAIAVCMLIGIATVAPISVGAVETQKVTTGATSGDYEYKLLDNGTAEISRYTGSGTSVTIPSQIDGYTVTSIGGSAFSDCTSLTSITIPDSVTTIGFRVFSDCKNLTNITIPNSVTSIGYGAFSGCESLTNITISDSVTTIGNGAFSDCTSLTNITIPGSVTTIGWNAFSGCTSLTSITIPDSVTTVGRDAFNNTAWYNNQPDGLVYAGKVAYKYKGWYPSEVIIKDGTKGIAGSAFEDCTSLTNITIPDSVTTIGVSAFSGTAWYNNQPDGLVYAGKVAYEYKGDCPSEVIVKDGTKGIGENAFWYCTSLTSITIPDSVTTIGDGAFFGCDFLTNITIPDSVTTIGNMAFYYCESLTSITISDSVTTIGNYAFEGCIGFTSITIPDSVTSIGYCALGYYFDSRGYVKIDNFVINGYTNSTAEKYANNNGFDFVSVGEMPTTSTTEPSTTQPSSTEPTTTEPTTTEPSTTEPSTTEPSTTEPSTTEPTTTEPTTTVPSTTQPSSTQPSSTQPSSTQPSSTQPSTTVPSTTKPVPTQPTTRPATVKKTSVTLAKSSATVYRTGKTTIKATVKNGKGKTTYKSSNTKIAKVTSNGVVTGVSKGTTRITVANNGVKKVFTVKVNNPTLNKNSVSVKKGKTFTLKIAGKIGTAKFTSSNKKIATVNAKGKITAKKKGTVTIKVKTNGITLVCKVKVN